MESQVKREAQAEHWKAWEPYFYETEFRSPDVRIARMDIDFMARLFTLRRRVGVAMLITSGYRTPAHNALVGGGKRSAHMEGRAADFHVDVAHMHDVIACACALGFTGIGLRGAGPWKRRFIHLDDADPHPDRPRPWLWSYDR